MVTKYISIVALLISFSLQSQTKIIKTEIYTVEYSEKLEQPVSLTYFSINRPKNVSRGSMNFKTVPGIKTSDDADYYKNPYDKGHLAPAATFSDSKENLKETFSYLNCALQHKQLNRYLWKYLEAEEREWDDYQELMVTVDIKFSDSILPTGATLPSKFIKHIKFLHENKYLCYEFENSGDLPKEKEYLNDYAVEHKH